MTSRPLAGGVESSARTTAGRLQLLGLAAVAYFLLSKATGTLLTGPDGISAVRPTAGFLLGWLLVYPRREWPLIAALAFVAHGLASPLFLTAPTTAAILAIASIGTMLFAATIIAAGVEKEGSDLYLIENLQRFGVSILLASVLYAAIAALALPGAFEWRRFSILLVSQIVGTVSVAPLFLTWEEGRAWLRNGSLTSKLELSAAVVMIAVMLKVGFLGPIETAEQWRPITVLIVLPLMWMALRGGTFAAPWGSALVVVGVSYGTAHGLGLYAVLTGDAYRHLMIAGLYLAVVVIITISIAIIVGGLRRALTSVASTEKWFRELANAAPIAMLVIEPDGQTIFYNNGLTSLWGYTRENMRTLDAFWRNIIPDFDERMAIIAEWRSRVTEAEAAGTPVRPLEIRSVTTGGEHRWVEMHGSNIQGRKIVLFVDRTSDREAIIARRAGEQLFRVLVDSAPIPMMVIERDGESVTLNRTFTELFGYEPHEITSIPMFFERMFPDPAYRRHQRTEWEKRLKDWRDKPGRFRPMTFEAHARDGRVFVVEGSTSQVGDRRLSTLVDLTERHRADAALRASETQFRAMFDSSALAISLVDLSGRPMKCNRALTTLLGYTEQELCAKSWMDVSHPEDIERDSVLFNELVAGKRDFFQVEKRYLRKNRSIVFARVTLSLIRDAKFEPSFYVSMVEDITERTHLEDALRQSQKMEAVGQLTSGISHDFNNLLSIIIGNIELATTQLGAHALPVERELADAAEAAHRGAEMIRKLLGFSRQAELKKEIINLSAVVSGFIRMLRRLLPSDIDIQITLDPSADAQTIRADIGAVEQILVNLATNARDAMPNGGRLEITVSRSALTEEQRANRPWLTDDDFLTLSVKDSGAGMNSATLAMIFEPFFTTKGEGKGTGLGMAMIDGLVKQHDGFVEVESEVGAGTTARAWFPAVGEGTWTFTGEFADTSALRGGTETILLVEDKEALRRVTTRLLEGLGYTVIPAPDGAQALNLYNRNRDRIDLVITDMVMPKMHGHQLHRAVRDTGSRVPFVFASGYSPAELRSRAALGEDVKHLPKPVTLETLARAIREALHLSNRRPLDESPQESDPGR